MTNFRCEVNGLLNGSFPWSFGSYFTGAVSEATAEAAWKSAMDFFFTDATNGFLKLCFTDITVDEYFTSTMSASWRQTTKTSDAVSHAGTSANSSLPYQDAEIITWRSNQANKAGHGRWYLPPVNQVGVVLGEFTSAVTAQIKTQATSVRTSMATAGLTMVIFNRATLVDGTPPFTLKTIISEDVPNLVAHQRRRADKRAAVRS